jgi:hypothetical protein
MHADNRGVDHLDSGIVGSGKCVPDATPDTSPPPTGEAVVARGVWTKHLGKITPRRAGAQDLEDAIEDTTVVHPRNATRFVRQHGLDGNPFIIGEFVAHDSRDAFDACATRTQRFSPASAGSLRGAGPACPARRAPAVRGGPGRGRSAGRAPSRPSARPRTSRPTVRIRTARLH